MRVSKKTMMFISIIFFSAIMVFLSCDDFLNSDEDPDKYKLLVWVKCSSSFTTDIIVNSQFPLHFESNNDLLVPVGKKETLTITAVKTDTAASLTIMVYKTTKGDSGYKLDKIAPLYGCTTTTTTSCTNTILLAYDVNDSKNLTKAVSGTTSSSSSTTSSGTTSTSSTSSSTTSSSTSSTSSSGTP